MDEKLIGGKTQTEIAAMAENTDDDVLGEFINGLKPEEQAEVAEMLGLDEDWGIGELLDEKTAERWSKEARSLGEEGGRPSL